MIIQAGDSDGGRDWRPTRRTSSSAATEPARRAGVLPRRQAPVGRVRPRPEELKILPAVSFAVGAPRRTPTSAPPHAPAAGQPADGDPPAGAGVEPPSSYDADGPVARRRPRRLADSIIQGRAPMFRDPLKTTAEWRALAEAKHLSIRELIIHTTGHQTFIGTPSQVAQAMNDFVQADGSDGFVLAPHLTPTVWNRPRRSGRPVAARAARCCEAEYDTSTLRATSACRRRRPRRDRRRRPRPDVPAGLRPGRQTFHHHGNDARAVLGLVGDLVKGQALAGRDQHLVGATGEPGSR